MRTALLACVLCLCPVAPGFAGPGEDGARAFKRGDYATARWFWRPLAEEGDAAAQYLIGYMYDRGLGVPQDHAVAVEWFRKAAEQGDAGAQHDLGVMYFLGRGVPQDYVVAVEWYRRAAEQGMGRSQYNLGLMYDKGRGVPQDDTAAAMWYRKAAEQGLAEAQFKLGVRYTKGLGVPQDYAAAHKWLNLAASRYPASEWKRRDKAAKLREAIATRMTPAQIAEAQRLAREWKPKKKSRRSAEPKIRGWSLFLYGKILAEQSRSVF